MRYLLSNKIQCPDGIILQSFHQHDCKMYKDKISGEVYMVDGGISYRRGTINTVPAINLCVYTDTPFEIIRGEFMWGSRGKDGKQPLTYKPLYQLTDGHIHAILSTQWHIPDYIRNVFYGELIWREEYNVWIRE